MSERSSLSVNRRPAYGALTAETSESKVTLNDIKNLGRIQVVWQRIHWGPKTLQFVTKEPSAISEVSEKVLKGKAIENAIKLYTPR